MPPPIKWPIDPDDPDDKSRDDDSDDDELSVSVGAGVFPATKPDVSALGPPTAPGAAGGVAATAVAPGAAAGAPGVTTAPPVTTAPAAGAGKAAIDEGGEVGAPPACTCVLGSWALPGTTTDPEGAGREPAAGSGAGAGGGVGDGGVKAGVAAGGLKLAMFPMLSCPMLELGSLMASTCPEATAPGHFCCMQVTTGVIPFCV